MTGIDLGGFLNGKTIDDLAVLVGGLLNDDTKEKLNEWIRAELESLIDKATGRREELIKQLSKQNEDLIKENKALKEVIAQIHDEQDSDDDGDSGDYEDPKPFEPPMPDPDPPVPVDNSPRYAPGLVEIPTEFLTHGAFRELRIEKCSLANGLLKAVPGSKTTFTLPMPTDEVWRWTDGQNRTPPYCIGTVAKFADGSQYDGYVGDYHGTYSMPVGQQPGAFWVRMK